MFFYLYLIWISILSSFSFLSSYCVWGFLFPGFSVEFFLPFGFCPPKVGPVVCVSFRVRFVQSFCLLACLFFLWWARLRDVVILSAHNWVCIFVVYCLDEVSCTGCYWWCQVLYSSGFLYVSSHYLILPGVSSLIL